MEEIKNGNTKNIDSLLLATFNEEVPSFLAANPEELTHDVESKPIQETKQAEVASVQPQDEASEPVETKAIQPSETDEFGNEIPKQEKVYTKAEVDALVNEKLRERLARMKQTDHQQPQAQPQMQSQAAVEGDWEVQLESFIEGALTKREQRLKEKQWQQQVQEAQAQFEIKFNQGVAKYPDFEQVVMGKPLTPQMVLATRGMSDPAAFIYAAAKTQTKELERISQINDPYLQAVEVGQLAEKMRKARSPVSQAPRPIDSPKGDVVDKKERTRNIDDKIQLEEKRVRQERMRR